MSAADVTPIPKTIWMMWWQGLDNAPHIVKRCHASWQRHNPGWTVTVLDETNYQDYLDLAAITASGNAIRLQALSDIIRVQLLARYGGVWVDATCFCCQPLDTWLSDHARPGFFAFDKPERNRVIDVWFLASSSGCYLTQELAKVTNYYWLSNSGLKLRPSKTLIDRFVLKALTLNISMTRFWFSYPVSKRLKVYPYLWLPFLFAGLLRSDPHFRRLWQDVKKISADKPHKLQQLGLTKPLSDAHKREIDSRPTPLYKLDWRYDQADYEGSILQYVLDEFDEAP